MNFQQRVQQVASQEGVEAVYALPRQAPAVFSGDEAFRDLAIASARIKARTSEPMIRVNAGTHAIFTSSDDDLSITLVFKKAHPVVKSVKRTMRQLLRKSQRERARAPRVEAPTTFEPANVAPPRAAI